MTDQNRKISEFKEFMETSPDRIDPPASYRARLMTRLFPNSWAVFGKVVLIHALFGFLSLNVCTQFGLNPLDSGFSLSAWFTKIGGEAFCMNMCGVFFIASTFVFANLFLTLEEMETIKRRKWLQSGVLSLASLAAFYFFGAQLVLTLVILWLLGALIGGALSVEITYRFRLARARASY